MTFTFLQDTKNGYYIEMSQEKYSNCYRVTVSEDFGGYCSSPFISNYYNTLDKAKRRYNYLMRKIKTNNI